MDDKKPKPSDLGTGMAAQAAKAIEDAKKRKKNRLDEIMGKMGHNKNGKYDQ